MAKKIYDIRPPKIISKVEENIKDFFEGDNKKRRSKGGRRRSRNFSANKPGWLLWQKIAVPAALLVVVLCIYLFFELPRADVKIWPKTETLTYKMSITADKTAADIDMDKKIIPALYLEEEKEGSQEFPATGSASNDGKAFGTIRIYNKYDPVSPVSLKTGTHFLSDSGKYFVTLQKVTVPAGKKQGGKITPGFIDVKVESEESGPGYNIKAAKFSIPKLSGTSYYYSVYAESSEPMSGGYTGKVKKVTEDDIQQAKDALTKKVLEDAKNALKGNISSEYVLLDAAISGETISSSSSVKAGTVAENFKVDVKAVSRTIVFKKSDLEKFAKNYLAAQTDDSKTMLEKSFALEYKPDFADISGGKITMNLDFSSKIYQSIDQSSLTFLFRRMTAPQIVSAVNSNYDGQISNVDVSLWPFWVKKAPKNQKAVNVELKFE